MEILYIILALILGLIIGGIIFWVVGRNKNSNNGNGESLVILQTQMNELSRLLDNRMENVRTDLKESTQYMQESIRGQFRESSQIIKDVTERLTKLDETNRQVVNFTDQLQELQDILKNPKHRGIVGEYYLETLLKNVLPPNGFEMQYKFADGEIVDAAVFVKDKIIPVDSKFSLENYNRLVQEKNEAEKIRLEKLFVGDLKQRIQETAKYIRPGEGTMDFAFMFIPHEAIYYDLLVNKIGAITEDTENLIQRAANKYKVIIVSPTSFLAYLQTVLQGLKAMQIEESAKEIRQRVGDLGRHIASYDQFLDKMGNSLGTTVNHYNNAYKEFKKIDKDVVKISGVGGAIEAVKIDKPNLDL
ncbi:MAG: recombination protein RmuC [Patescibacteria group bacterium]|nr:recombination protein RmuC [Patescibacteria group bacterium]